MKCSVCKNKFHPYSLSFYELFCPNCLETKEYLQAINTSLNKSQQIEYYKSLVEKCPEVIEELEQVIEDNKKLIDFAKNKLGELL